MSPVTERYSNGMGFSWNNSNEADSRQTFNLFSTDADAVKTLGFKLVAGRDIDSYRYATDSNAMLLTETAVKKMRLENPIGQTVVGWGNKWTVVGVIKDFIIDSPYDQISPLLVFGPKSYFTSMHYRLNPDKETASNLKTIADIFKKFNPDYPFEYEFIDKNYAAKFKEMHAIGRLSLLFAALTIFISCLGLFALIAYLIESRMKEIAVRKVLGASLKQMMALLSFNFLKLILIAIAIAIPTAYWVMQEWLLDYHYRIQIQWYYFALAAAMALLISLATISIQTIKAAMANPVRSLRDE